MMTCPTRPFRFVMWLSLIVIGRLIYKGRTQDTNTTLAYACSLGVTGTCINFDIACGHKERIRIMSAGYGFGTDQSCMTDTIWNCGDKSGCCAVRHNEQTRSSYSEKHFYDLVKVCSSKERCNPQAAFKSLHKYSAVRYKCAPDTHVKFCKNTYACGNKISLVYEGRIPREKVCWCVVKAANNFLVTAQDFRFLDQQGQCIDSMNLTGFQVNETISCSKLHQFIPIWMEKRSTYSEFKLSLPSNANVEMVWIVAEGQKSEPITAQCFVENREPPPEDTNTKTTTSFDTGTVFSEETDTTPTTSSSATTVSSEQTDTTKTTSSNTTTFKTSSNSFMTTSSTSAPAKLAAEAPSSEDVPVAAIVCPVALVLVGVIAGFVIWRKRRLRHDKLEETQQVNTNTSGQRKSDSTNRDDYDNLKPHKNDIKGANNYMMLQEENIYNYIDHSEVHNNKRTKVKTSNTAENTCTYKDHSDTRDDVANNTEICENKGILRQTKESDNNNYFILEPQSSSLSDTTNNKGPYTTSINEASEAKLDNTTSGSHNYFLLEPQGISTAEQSSKKQTTDVSETGTHNYFVLEPQSTLEANSDGADDANKSKMETTVTANHNDFVLEPQDTYSSIDLDDVVVQTLPDDEYNVLTTKSKEVIQDPNYDAITARQHEKEIIETDNYSHLENTIVKNQPFSNYSRVNLKTDQTEKEIARDDKYLHLGSTLVKPSTLHIEENDYSHLKANSK